jgi:hypothetical protein
MSNPAPEPFDLDALRHAVAAAVRKALDTREFQQAVDAAVARYVAGIAQEARTDDLSLAIKAAVVAPVWREVLGADGLPEGLTDPLLVLDRDAGDIGSHISAAIRDAVNRATEG